MRKISLRKYTEDKYLDLVDVVESIKKSSLEISKLLKYKNCKEDIKIDKNFSGDIQNKVDILSHNIFVENILETKRVSTLISEEADNPINYKHTVDKQTYSFVIDPLDGSSNIDCNIPVGTIFGIYKNKKNNLTDILGDSENLVCSGYILYSFSTELVLTFRKGVVSFMYDDNEEDFIMENDNLKFPEMEKHIFSVNIGNCENWDKFSQEIFFTLIENNYTSRYIGSMVADIHRTLFYGGIFSYPKDKKNKNGKLRLIYECKPISLIVEQAGGFSTDGEKNILDIKAKNIHQKTGFFSGSPKIMKKLFPDIK
jgi:fructose-1,6-bisphosphatase I